MARIASQLSSLPLVAPAMPVVERERGLGTRRPVAYLTWLFWGAIGTYVDRIHEAFGVVAYPNPEWIGRRLPISPAYLAASTGFFALYTLMVGHRPQARQGLLGGEPVRVLDIGYALGCWFFAYVVSGVLGTPARTHGALPWFAGLVLCLTAMPALWNERRTRLPQFALVVAMVGVTFEWSATSHGLFTYPVCPSEACLETTVPLAWLPGLYLHAALFIHRLLRGRHLLRPSLAPLQPSSVNSAGSSSSSSSASSSS